MTAGTTLSKRICRLYSTAVFVLLCTSVRSETLYQSQQLTPNAEYTFGIEGPAVDTEGTLYVVNFGKPGTIGKLPAGAKVSEPFAVLPEGSVGNAIRFDRAGRMFIADWKKHNIFAIDRGSSEPVNYFHSDEFNQPNDLTIAGDGTIYASDPNWKGRSGQIWRIAKGADGNVGGERMQVDRRLGTTNGIDLSPDGKTLYVGESDTNELWAYQLDGEKLNAPRLVKKFDGFDIDGVRTDADGKIFVARILKGTIAIITPDGKLLREITLKAKEPTNLAFGGLDGKTVFVTQRQGGFIESFQTDRPGREFCVQKAEC
jgi:sugar lactone lactonase YvrE